MYASSADLDVVDDGDGGSIYNGDENHKVWNSSQDRLDAIGSESPYDFYSGATSTIGRTPRARQISAPVPVPSPPKEALMRKRMEKSSAVGKAKSVGSQSLSGTLIRPKPVHAGTLMRGGPHMMHAHHQQPPMMMYGPPPPPSSLGGGPGQHRQFHTFSHRNGGGGGGGGIYAPINGGYGQMMQMHHPHHHHHPHMQMMAQAPPPPPPQMILPQQYATLQNPRTTNKKKKKGGNSKNGGPPLGMQVQPPMFAYPPPPPAGSVIMSHQDSSARSSLAMSNRKLAQSAAAGLDDSGNSGAESPGGTGIYKRKGHLNERAFSYSIRQEHRSRSHGSLASLQFNPPDLKKEREIAQMVAGLDLNDQELHQQQQSHLRPMHPGPGIVGGGTGTFGKPRR